jgi:hypothetical protein
MIDPDTRDFLSDDKALTRCRQIVKMLEDGLLRSEMTVDENGNPIEVSLVPTKRKGSAE